MPRFVAFALACVLATPCARAAVSTWSGAADTAFANAANWNTLPADDLLTDVATFTGTPTASQPRLAASRSVKGLVFSTTTGGWTLSAASPANTLTLGASGLFSTGQTGGINTLGANLSLGAAQTWAVGTGGRLLITGSVTQTSGFSWTLNNSTHLGTITLSPAPGRSVNLSGANDTASLIQVKSGGLLQLGGTGGEATTSVNTLKSTSSTGGYGTWGINAGGKVQVNSGTWITGDLGKNGGDNFNGTLEVTGGGISFTGARYLGGGTINVSGGTLAVTASGATITNGGRFSLGAYNAGTAAAMTITGGLVDLAQANGGNSFGTVIGTQVDHSGGTLQNGVTPGGGTNGGTIDTLTLGAGGATANVATAYTLRGTGVLISAGAIQGQAFTGAGNLSNFNFNGGTLATGAFIATNLGYASATGVAGGGAHASPVANSVGIGTLCNNGGTLAPGGTGTAGKTTITGNYAVNSGTLAIDLGGTTAASAFQHVSGCYDTLSVTGATTLGGQLAVSVLPGFTPASGQTFTVLTSTGALSGTFTNAASGTRIVSADGLHTFLVTQSATSVTLSNYLPVVAPAVATATSPSAIGAGDAVLLGVTPGSLAPVTYEWYKDGVLIDGATSGTLTLLNFQAADAATYSVTLRNAAGSVTRDFSVRVTTPPSTVTVLLDAGATQTFNAAAGAVSYQWILDGDTVGTSAAFTYSPVNQAVGTHWLRVIETYADASTVTRHWNVRVRISQPATALAYYVSPTGSDTAAGTFAAPFATLEKARDTLRLLSSGQRSGGVTVYLRGGIHRRTTTFALAAQDSGTESAPIVYAAYPGETPILTSTRVLAASQWSPLAASEQGRAAPGVDVTRIWETDVTGNARAAAFPDLFNEWLIYNALRTAQNGGLLEVFYQGERMRISRYPNLNLADDTQTPNLAMNGVAPGADYAAPGTTATGYLNGAGTYTLGDGSTSAVGGAFQYSAADAAHVARWQTALASGGVWLGGYWRVPWQLNYAKVKLIDPAKQTIGLVTAATNPSTAALISNGIGDKYNRPAGSKKEPWWVVNLLEELDQPGEWCIDFNRKKLYFLMDRAGSPADAEIELADVGTPLIQLSGASDVRLQGLTFRRHLGVNVQVLNGSRVLLLGCAFAQSGNMAVDINGGNGHGVVSSDFEKLASGGVMLRGSATASISAPSDHFAVNNRFRSFSEVVRVYQAAVDIGYGGPLGSWGTPTYGMRAAHNDIRTSPHAGILWSGYNNIIEYNEVSDFTRISNDLGAIYRFGPNIDSGTVIRYNHLYSSPLGEGVYNDFDHVRTPIYGNVMNLKTPSTAQRGFGIWTTTNTATGGNVPGVSMALRAYNNISVNCRDSFYFHSTTGGTIQNNLSFHALDSASPINWRQITINATTNTASVATVPASTLQSGPNLHYTSDPGFIDFANDDLRLRPDAPAYRDLPGFVPVPLEMSGLYNDELRPAAARVWTPFIVTNAALSVGANTATFAGTLAYPQFDPNATVRVYWGTGDGGTDPAAWQNVTLLGQPGSGHVAYTPANLAPGTRYYYRFHALNSAGEHWAEQTNSTTTYPLAAAPSGGAASATSTATPATNAFDGDPATAWQTAGGNPTGMLTYQFAGNTPVRLTRYSVTSAADTPARDPRDWRFEGSLDGLAWTVLDTRSGVVFSARGQTLDFGFVNNSAFLFHRLVVTANNGDPAGLQLAELKLWTPSIVADTTGPVLATPGNLTVEAATASGANVDFDVSALDAVSGNCIATATPAAGSLFPIGTTVVTVTAQDAAGNTSTTTFTLTVTSPSLPAPWTLRQINPYAGVAAGTATVNLPVPPSTSFTITGTGGASAGGINADMWTGSSDSFTYVSQPWSGDGTFTARLASLTSADTSAKAGLIFRETTAAGSRYSGIYLMRANSGAVWAQHKTATGGSTTNVNFFTASSTSRGIPEWIRLVRQGDVFTCYYSETGTSWTQLGTARTNLLSGSTLSVGFVAAPRTGNSTVTATFDNISFLTPLQTWRQSNFATTAASGNAADLADPDGDGYPNLLEYALGTSPLTRDSGLITSQVVEDRLTLTFARIADPTLTYRVESGSSLSPADWVEIWQSTGAANTAGYITVADIVDLSTASPPRRFLRLRVTTP